MEVIQSVSAHCPIHVQQSGDPEVILPTFDTSTASVLPPALAKEEKSHLSSESSMFICSTKIFSVSDLVQSADDGITSLN